MPRKGLTLTAAAVLGLAGFARTSVADEPATTRQAATWPGLARDGSVLLPNGWSLRPAGRQSKLGDFPVLAALHPTEPVLAVLHDLALAAHFFPRLLLLDHGRLVEDGAPADVLTPDRVRAVYGVDPKFVPFMAS